MRAPSICLARALALIACSALLGCEGYHSAYEAPLDGRARLIWNGDSPMFLGPEMPPACRRAIDPNALEYTPYSRPSHYYVVGPPVVFVAAPLPLVHPAPIGPRPGFGGGLFSAGRNKEATAVLAVVVLAALPFVALGLAVGNPESSGETSSAMDRVNAFNDLSRQPGTPCSYDFSNIPQAVQQ